MVVKAWKPGKVDARNQRGKDKKKNTDVNHSRLSYCFLWFFESFNRKFYYLVAADMLGDHLEISLLHINWGNQEHARSFSQKQSQMH